MVAKGGGEKAIRERVSEVSNRRKSRGGVVAKNEDVEGVINRFIVAGRVSMTSIIIIITITFYYSYCGNYYHYDNTLLLS